MAILYRRNRVWFYNGIIIVFDHIANVTKFYISYVDRIMLIVWNIRRTQYTYVTFLLQWLYASSINYDSLSIWVSFRFFDFLNLLSVFCVFYLFFLLFVLFLHWSYISSLKNYILYNDRSQYGTSFDYNNFACTYLHYLYSTCWYFQNISCCWTYYSPQLYNWHNCKYFFLRICDIGLANSAKLSIFWYFLLSMTCVIYQQGYICFDLTLESWVSAYDV